MTVELLLPLAMLLCSFSLLTTGQQTECTYIESTAEIYATYVHGSFSSSYACGSFGWETCYRIHYNSQLRYASRVLYRVETRCCSGYHSVDGECSPTCTSCPESHSCLAPYFCACPENWSGEDCTEPPQSVTLTATGTNSLMFSWSPPPQLDATLYVIIFQNETYYIDDSSNLVMELDSLMTYTAYTCCVAANTASGPSKISCVTQTTLQAAPEDSPQNVTVTTLNSTAIHIQWDPPLTPNGIIIFYTIYINGVPLLNITTTSDTQNTSVGGLFPNQRVNVSLSASTVAGEGPQTALQTVTTHETVPGQVENLQVDAIDANTIKISWDPPTYPNGVLTGYTVQIKNLINSSETTSNTISPSSNQLIVDRRISPYVRYSVSVTASTAVGSGDPVEQTLYSQEGAPQSPPPNVTSTRISPTTASVEWDEIVLEDLRGWLESYEVEYESVTSGDQCATNTSSNTGTVSLDQETYRVTGLDPGLQYCVRVAGRTSAGVGPFSHTLTPWYVNSVFTVTLERENCTEWIAELESDKIVEDLATEISKGVGDTCDCMFPSNYIAGGQLMCQNQNQILFQGRLISTENRNSVNLLSDLEAWLSLEPTVLVQGEELRVVSNKTLTPEMTPSGKHSKFSLVPIIGGGAGIVVIIAIVFVGTVALCHKNRNSRKGNTSDRYTTSTTIPTLDKQPLTESLTEKATEKQSTLLEYEMVATDTAHVYHNPNNTMRSTAMGDLDGQG